MQGSNHKTQTEAATAIPQPVPESVAIPAGPQRHARVLTDQQTSVISDLALTAMQKSRGKYAALATILAGKLNELEPKEFRQTMGSLIDCLSDSSLDYLGRLFGVRRHTARHRGSVPESDKCFGSRLFYSLPWPGSFANQQVGISLRTVLHFRPQATLAQQEEALEKTIKTVADAIVRTEADQTFRINDLWVIVRFTAQHVVVDAGDPNQPFEEILLWREGKPEPLTGNYIVKPEESLIIEPSLPAAIDIRPAGGRLDV